MSLVDSRQGQKNSSLASIQTVYPNGMSLSLNWDFHLLLMFLKNSFVENPPPCKIYFWNSRPNSEIVSGYDHLKGTRPLSLSSNLSSPQFIYAPHFVRQISGSDCNHTIDNNVNQFFITCRTNEKVNWPKKESWFFGLFQRISSQLVALQQHFITSQPLQIALS